MATHPHVARPSIEQQRPLARQYIQSLQEGIRPVVHPDTPDYEPLLRDIDTMFQACHGDKQTFSTGLQRLMHSNEQLKELFNPTPVSNVFSPIPTIEIVSSPVIVPPLSDTVKFSDELIERGCKWLDDYTSFSTHWSPRGYEGFHVTCGAWVLSTIAARRVWVPHGPGGQYTPLFLALVAGSTGHAKTTTAGIAEKVLYGIGLDWMMMPDTVTPQKLLSNMAGRMPANYDKLDFDAQELVKKRLAFSGQVSWLYDEFGQQMDSMTAKNGVMSDFKGIMRRFDDCKDTASNDTHARGLERVENPYMSLLATIALPDMQPYAGRNSKFWSDGFFARFSFSVPPRGSRKKDWFPDGDFSLPSSLSIPLRRWHERLGEPDFDIQEERDEKGNVTGYLPVRGELPRIRYDFASSAIKEALYRYSDALDDLIEQHRLDTFASIYQRLPIKALRLAALFASLENCQTIELRHWAKGQAIAEEWRASLHELYSQVNDVTSTDNSIEEGVLDFLKVNQERAFTVRDIQRMAPNSIRQQKSGVLRDILRTASTSGDVEVMREHNGKIYVERYKHASQVSHEKDEDISL